MAEDGIPAYSDSGPGSGANPVEDDAEDKKEVKMKDHIRRKRVVPLSRITSPTLPAGPNYFSRKNTSIDVEDYFTGPRDIQKHSKWPLFLRMHGSILPKMLLPLICVGVWATAVTVISELVFELGVESILLTVLGFVVALGLSFRSSTAYERYAEGRRYWAQLIMSTQVLGRLYWVHASDNPGISRKRNLLRRVSCLNLILSFCIALKHKLRFEPYAGYEDLRHLVAHLDTFARDATAADPDASRIPRKSFFKEVGEYLGLSFAESNPRKVIKKASRPLGSLPLEILSHLGVLSDAMCAQDQLVVPMHQTMAYSNLSVLNDVLTGTERVLTTPLPIAYTIAIAQITWLYVILLPFQLRLTLGWITIPASLAASYIILGILFIGREIENPFGHDVNDLPLEAYCEQIAHELDVIASTDVRRGGEDGDPWELVESEENLPLYPVSMASYPAWIERGTEKIEAAIKGKPAVLFDSRRKSSDEREREERRERGEARKKEKMEETLRHRLSGNGQANGNGHGNGNGSGNGVPRGDEQV